jgi:glutamine synthetase
MKKNLSKIAKTKKIKYFLISFVDLFGVLRSKLVPTEAIGEMQKNGAGFAGFAKLGWICHQLILICLLYRILIV